MQEKQPESTENEKLHGYKVKIENCFISYKELSELLQKRGYNTSYLDIAIEKDKPIHSIYFKPDGEVQYLFDSQTAETFYQIASFGIYHYKEMELSELLKYLNYTISEEFDCNIEEDYTTLEHSLKKSKFLTFQYTGIFFSYRKKLINSIRYFPDGDLFIDTEEFKEKPTVFKKVDKSTYDIIMSQL